MVSTAPTGMHHLREAFHGRSGYTLSLTNTDPVKVARFPKFDWPRIDAPYLRPDADMAGAGRHRGGEGQGLGEVTVFEEVVLRQPDRSGRLPR